MGWVSVRKADLEDIEALDKAAVKFMQRHSLELYGTMLFEYDIENSDIHAHVALEQDLEQLKSHCYTSRGRYIERLWKKCMARALRVRKTDGIAYGCVGYSVE